MRQSGHCAPARRLLDMPVPRPRPVRIPRDSHSRPPGRRTLVPRGARPPTPEPRPAPLRRNAPLLRARSAYRSLLSDRALPHARGGGEPK